MLLHIQRTIDELKNRISSNVSLIKKYRNAINSMAMYLDEYAGQYEEFIKLNRSLLEQNNDLINVQLTLMNFIEKYKETAILEEEAPLLDIYSITDRQEVFMLTVKDIVPFDEKHPYYRDTDFIEKLLVYYSVGSEDYEKCQKLMHLKESIM